MFTVDLGTGLITIASSTGVNPEFIFEHGKHVQLINQMTYEFILFEIINDHEDHIAMFGKKRKSKKRKSNRRRRSR